MTAPSHMEWDANGTRHTFKQQSAEWLYLYSADHTPVGVGSLVELSERYALVIPGIDLSRHWANRPMDTKGDTPDGSAMLQEFVDKLNDRYPAPGNCGIIALALVSGSHYLKCREFGAQNGWRQDGMTCQGFLMALKDLEVKYEIYDGERKRLKTWGKMPGMWVAKTKDHFSVIVDGELVNPVGCENHEVHMLLKIL